MKSITIKSALQKMGAADIQMKDMSTPTFPYDRSGFFTATRDSETFKKGTTYYFSYSPEMARFGLDSMMYRIAKDRNDFHGEANQWEFSAKLARMGFKIATPKPGRHACM